MADITQWNCRGYHGNYHELRSLLSATSAVVASLQETKCGGRDLNAPRGYAIYNKPGPDRLHGGSALIIHNSRPHAHYGLQTELQAVAVQIQLRRKVTICSLYLPPNENISFETLSGLIEQLPTPFLLLGDFNARHQLWGDVVVNQRGRIVERLILTENLTILNDGNPTHHHIQTNSMSCIDLSICSSCLTNDFEWTICDDLYGSDHFPIKLKLRNHKLTTRIPRFNFRRADWSLFRAELVYPTECIDQPNIDETIETFNSSIINAAEKSIPKTGSTFRSRPVPWWNDQCKQAIAAQKRAFRRYRRSSSLTDKVEYNRLRAIARYTIKQARKTSWETYIGTITQETSPSKVWKKIQKISGKYSPTPQPILEVNGNIVTDPTQVANMIGTSLAETSSAYSYNEDFKKYKTAEERKELNFNDSTHSGYNSCFSEEELKRALHTCSDTAEGPDKIHFSMLRNLTDAMIKLLLEIYNRIWVRHEYPSSWCESIIIPFLKQGKNPKITSSYRPISLTSCTCKLMEKMVNARLVYILERDNLISDAQNGFRKNRSTTDVLVRLETDIRDSLAQNQNLTTVYFDIAKAYDTTWRYGVGKCLMAGGFRGNLPIFICNFLSNRTFKVRIGSSLSQSFLQQEGVPQGSVLSVTCFAMAINSLPECVGPDVKCSLYVDDFVIYSSSHSMAALERRLQRTIDKIQNWTLQTGFRISVEKTVVVNYNKKRGVQPQPDLYMNGSRLTVAEEHKFLGLIFDKKLTWIPHIKQLKNKCIKKLDIIKHLANTSWGADRDSLLRIYNSLVRSKLDYGCEAYSSAKHNVLRMLDSVHHSGLRISIGAFRSSPIDSLYCETEQLSLQSIRDLRCLQLYTRMLRKPDSVNCRTTHKPRLTLVQTPYSNPKLQKPFGLRAELLLSSLNLEKPLVIPVSTTIPPWSDIKINVCTDLHRGLKSVLEPEAVKMLALDHMCQHCDDTPIYTDGSKSATGVGCATIFPDTCFSMALPAQTSVFTAEAVAIYIALKNIKSDTSNTRYTIFSDSLSSLAAIRNVNHNSPLISKIYRNLLRLQTEGRIISFCWIPSHVGISGNEEADVEAKNESLSVNVNPCHIPHSDYYADYKRKLNEKFKQHWQSLENNKLRKIKQNLDYWWSAHLKSRRKSVVLCRLRIGHTRLTHGFLMDRSNRPYCEGCLVPLTVEHILSECPEYLETRRQTITRGYGGQIVPLADILANKKESIDSLFEFLTRTGLIGKV